MTAVRVSSGERAICQADLAHPGMERLVFARREPVAREGLVEFLQDLRCSR